MAPQVFTIGEAAARAGVSADTLRYYERQGVLSPSRTPAGYRVYSAETITRIRLIKNAVSFGFAVKQLAVFLRACDGGRPPCQTVRHAGAELLADMERRIAEMTTARDEMRSLLTRWDRALDMTPTGRPGSAARLHPGVAVESNLTPATLTRRPTGNAQI